jgi:hypothetical protein
MPYSVVIRKNETGETRTRHFTNLDWKEGSHFWWTAGNFGCDCNRHLEFERAGGRPESDGLWDEAECSDGRYTVLHADLPDGRRILIDDEESVAT